MRSSGRNNDDDYDEECGPMDRFAIRQIVCKECHMLQDSKWVYAITYVLSLNSIFWYTFHSSPPTPLYYRTNECTNCGISFAEYHCPKCNIWMALNKRPFHCDECGKFLLVCLLLLFFFACTHMWRVACLLIFSTPKKIYFYTLRSSFSLFINSPSLFLRLL